MCIISLNQILKNNKNKCIDYLFYTQFTLEHFKFISYFSKIIILFFNIYLRSILERLVSVINKCITILKSI